MRTVVFFVALLLAVGPAHALRCGNAIVSKGDSTMTLRHECGEPTQVEQVVDRVPYRAYDQLNNSYYTAYEERPYEVWTYNFGPNRFVQRIVVKDGKIQSIESQGYGY
ncbi:DUF2845 domain-containing protein [Thiohalocapsa marina]|uniref:DUF2845 domain-containing protein n=1 Tax=Thiohalocapsa marina TaxID=424902 RepID=A0A5M8FNS6_9GAMM|nr:DUF2845 domain-containing protein [Thiohalocapsa marina]KAA6185650.1 DUF2845 domain-containing protein [Thiohalocapsa marina]